MARASRPGSATAVRVVAVHHLLHVIDVDKLPPVELLQRSEDAPGKRLLTLVVPVNIPDLDRVWVLAAQRIPAEGEALRKVLGDLKQAGIPPVRFVS